MRIRTAGLLLTGLVLAGSGAIGVVKHRQAIEERQERAALITGGDVERGRAAFLAYGCGGCHALGGIPQANGQVGPPLDGVGARAVLAGRLANRPANMMRWIREPQAFSPGSAMPDLGITPAQARDLAAFLYAQP